LLYACFGFFDGWDWRFLFSFALFMQLNTSFLFTLSLFFVVFVMAVMVVLSWKIVTKKYGTGP